MANESCCEHGGHDGQRFDVVAATHDRVRDSVCGMMVDPRTTPHRHQMEGSTYHFCSERCREKFASDPEGYLNPPQEDPAVLNPAMGSLPQAAEGSVWTCPMHPEVRRPGPDSCPICGMALEPLEPTLGEGPNPELVDFTRRFWVAAALSVPLLILAMGSELLDWHLLEPQLSSLIQLG